MLRLASTCAVSSLVALIACGPPPGRPSRDGAEDTTSGGSRSLSSRGGELTEGQVGVVSIDRILQETERGQRAAARLEEEGRQAQAQLLEYQERLQELGESLQEAQSTGASESDLRQMADAYQQLAVEAQQAQASLQQQLEQRREALTRPIYDAVRRVAADIGDEDGYALILEGAGAPFAEPSADLTDRIITVLEEETAQSSIDAELSEGATEE